jgi:hypothetical protein
MAERVSLIFFPGHQQPHTLPSKDDFTCLLNHRSRLDIIGRVVCICVYQSKTLSPAQSKSQAFDHDFTHMDETHRVQEAFIELGRQLRLKASFIERQEICSIANFIFSYRFT